MRLKNTWILLVIAAGFLIYFFAVEQPRHEKNLAGIEQSSKITSLSLQDIHYVMIERRGETVAFERVPEGWVMTSPVEDLADKAAVNTLISSAVGARIESVVESGGTDASRYGLGSTPDATLLLFSSGKDSSLTMRIGGHNITKSHCYVQVDASAEVVLLPAGLRRYALQEVSEFRDISLIDFVLADVARMQLSGPARTLSWSKDSQGRWAAVVAGDTISGNRTEIEAILHRLRGIRIKSFMSDDPLDLSTYFAGPAGTISFSIAEESTACSVLFSARDADSCFAVVEGGSRIVSIDATILSAFDRSYDDLRDKNILHFVRDDVVKIRMVTSDTTATVIKLASEWTFANPAMSEIDQTKINDLLVLLQGLRFRVVLASRLDGSSLDEFNHPALRVSLYDDREMIVDEFFCSRPQEDGQARATSRTSAILGTVPGESLKAVEQAFRGIRSQ
ncbi:MAG: DUF4340 domain-containing protein [Candidatus Latescibacterota bacterium]